MKSKDAMISELVDLADKMPAHTLAQLLRQAKTLRRLCVQEFRD